MSASVTAVISKEWKQRMVLMGAVLAGLGGWFLFDGLVAYPRHNVWASAYFDLKKQHGDDEAALGAAWAAMSQERKWPGETPKKIHTPGDIRTQLILGAIALLGAGAVFLHFRRSLSTTTRLAGGVIFLPDGREIPLSQVRALSKRRWDSKGIADLASEPEPGVSVRFVLDDYKYVGAAEILAEVEKVLAPDGQSAAIPPDKASY